MSDTFHEIARLSTVAGVPCHTPALVAKAARMVLELDDETLGARCQDIEGMRALATRHLGENEPEVVEAESWSLEELETMSKSELVDLAKSRGLSGRGSKGALISRILGDG